MPMKVEDRLTSTGTNVDDHSVVLESGFARRLGNELEHALRLVSRELSNVSERIDMTLRKHEQMHLGLRIDVAYRDEAIGSMNVITLLYECAEETVRLGHRQHHCLRLPHPEHEPTR